MSTAAFNSRKSVLFLIFIFNMKQQGFKTTWKRCFKIKTMKVITSGQSQQKQITWLTSHDSIRFVSRAKRGKTCNSCQTRENTVKKQVGFDPAPDWVGKNVFRCDWLEDLVRVVWTNHGTQQTEKQTKLLIINQMDFRDLKLSIIIDWRTWTVDFYLFNCFVFSWAALKSWNKD